MTRREMIQDSLAALNNTHGVRQQVLIDELRALWAAVDEYRDLLWELPSDGYFDTTALEAYEEGYDK